MQVDIGKALDVQSAEADNDGSEMDCNSDGQKVLNDKVTFGKAILIQGDKAANSDDELSPGKNLLDMDEDMPDAYKDSVKMAATAKKQACETSMQVHTGLGQEPNGLNQIGLGGGSGG